jgi:hypothetical protein
MPATTPLPDLPVSECSIPNLKKFDNRYLIFNYGVRAAIRADDVKTAMQYAKVYEAKLIAPLEDRNDEQG